MSTPYSEYEAIVATVQIYIDGGRSGRSDDMKPAFHETATISGYLGPDLITGPIQQLYDYVDSTDAAKDLQGRITSIDISDTVATVRLELDNWAGHRFTDMYTLLKSNGEWKIISKVFHLHA
ncbi:MAG: nuclear transport factor 2 family protein [Bryobacterales bacterium]|nr:nuclear transport factor 2 family protein [Bryobacterales bacterium]